VSSDPRGGSCASEAAADIDAILAEFAVALGRPERVAACCGRIREALCDPRSGMSRREVLRLLPLLAERSGAVAEPLFALLDELARSDADPWPYLHAMLAARDRGLARRALASARRLAEQGRLRVRCEVLRALERIAEAEGSPLDDREVLGEVARIAERMDEAGALFAQHEDDAVRRLAARILDRAGEPAPEERAAVVLGREAHGFLAPYLAYTRASHLDLLHLCPVRDAPPPALQTLRRAEAVAGRPLLLRVLGELGWSRLNLGLEAVRLCGVRLDGSYPFRVLPGEAKLLEGLAGARRADDAFLFIAHGGRAGAPAGVRADDPISRFRAYNLAHAESLSEILDVAPLDREKVLRILGRMDRIVDDYLALFSPHSDECALLPCVYRELRERITRELDGQDPHAPLSAELTRLVQTFEDPGSLGRVETLHGLKRYLHQKGLRLGSRLAGVGRATNRTVDLVVASHRRVERIYRGLRYVDFEPDEERGWSRIPDAVSVVVEGFARPLLHGQESLPDVRVFCYGNEVHYFLAYGNHPAFVRVDYAPPLRGGMIDLEYYGVSKNELGLHPDPGLEALRVVFRRLEFDVSVDRTHVHARYDKERALDAEEVARKAEALFRLAPYLMEIDWTIGFLELDAVAKREVAETWAEALCCWGHLPLRELLTPDRTGVVASALFTPPPAGRFAPLRPVLARLGVEDAALLGGPPDRPAGQLALESGLLHPLRRALEVGQIVETPEGYVPAPPDRFRRDHEAEILARILTGGDNRIAEARAVAALVEPLERTLRLRTTGTVHGHEVQRATLALPGRPLTLCALRDGGGRACLAFFARGATLGRWREGADHPWATNVGTDALELAALLRRAGFLPAATGAPDDASARRNAAAESLRRPGPLTDVPPLAGERTIRGLRASPGRAVGPALFGTAGRAPRDLDGAVLIAPCLRPEDNSFLYRAAAVVSTGGGVLSHAGLIAVQFHKPALIVEGRWAREPDGRPVLRYGTQEYRVRESEVRGLRVTARTDVREREHELHEGDLVVVDAYAGTLQVLGGGREALALHEGLRHFGEAGRRLGATSDEREILALRGRRLRARHQIEKLLARLRDPLLARHAVRELLVGAEPAGAAGGPDERAALLSLVLSNPAVNEHAREFLLGFARELRAGQRDREERFLRGLATARYAFEIVSERLSVARLRGVVSDVSACLEACGLGTDPVDADRPDTELPARRRLEEMRAGLRMAIGEARRRRDPRLRHLVRQIDRVDRVLRTPSDRTAAVEEADSHVRQADAALRDRLASARVLRSGDAGYELARLVGWKAANLAEVERLAGGGLVPGWFVVTDRAFRTVLASPVGRLPLGAAVQEILSRDDADHGRKSRLIGRLWQDVEIPGDLAREVIASYRELRREDEVEPFVSIRSSSLEEDAEIAARAGEFETFLFVRGEEAVLDHLRRAWSGLWTERAIHNREVLGTGAALAGGGTIVQRIVRSRVSGVLQTVNVAEGNLREIVINAGLGLGEGVVSGTVGADWIVVSKQGVLEGDPPRLRYVTADKREQVVFDRRSGTGTVRSQTLYHQRLRPALEYVELCGLVRIAARLEAAYGYPLDVEFGIEGTRLWILQVRPVASFLSDLRETLERHPLAAARRGDAR